MSNQITLGTTYITPSVAFLAEAEVANRTSSGELSTNDGNQSREVATHLSDQLRRNAGPLNVPVRFRRYLKTRNIADTSSNPSRAKENTIDAQTRASQSESSTSVVHASGESDKENVDDVATHSPRHSASPTPGATVDQEQAGHSESQQKASIVAPEIEAQPIRRSARLQKKQDLLPIGVEVPSPVAVESPAEQERGQNVSASTSLKGKEKEREIRDDGSETGHKSSTKKRKRDAPAEVTAPPQAEQTPRKKSRVVKADTSRDGLTIAVPPMKAAARTSRQRKGRSK